LLVLQRVLHHRHLLKAWSDCRSRVTHSVS
jgi:hypothetical protein